MRASPASSSRPLVAAASQSIAGKNANAAQNSPVFERTVPKPARGEGFRRGLPRFQQDALRANLALAAGVREIAARVSVTPAQVALAWVVAQGEDVVPTPGTKTPKYLVDNAVPRTPN